MDSADLTGSFVVGIYNIGQREQPVAAPPPPKPSDCIRLVVISDTHCNHDVHQIPEGDILVHAGDFTNESEPAEVDGFVAFLSKQPHKHKIVVAGNHDVTAEFKAKAAAIARKYADNPDATAPVDVKPQSLKEKLSGVSKFLDYASLTIEGLLFYGISWPQGGPFSRANFRLIPSNVDILVTHHAPAGFCSKSSLTPDAGNPELRIAVEDKRPKLHLFGHLHEGYGTAKNEFTTFVNAAIVDRMNPVVIDVRSRLSRPSDPPFV